MAAKISAGRALRIAALIEGIVGVGLIGLGVLQNGAAPPGPRLVPAIFGIVIVGVALGGPGRILAKRLKLPEEILSAIRVQAIALGVTGLALLVGALMGSPTSAAIAFVAAGLSLLAAAWAGFYTLSTRMPATFHLHEMLAIIKSAGLTGKTADSAADTAFRRWSPGAKEGVPVGRPAPDGPVFSMTTGDDAPNELSSYFPADDQPLVLNLGSYSCPHHRKRLPELEALMATWKPKGVRFLTVYTAEAHPEDGWALTDQYKEDAEFTETDDFCFLYAKSIADRRAMAQQLLDAKAFTMEMVLDAMDDALLQQYNSWPIRLYIVQGGIVRFSGAQGPFGYDVPEVEAALRLLVQP